jgi:hypothetical protein
MYLLSSYKNLLKFFEGLLTKFHLLYYCTYVCSLFVTYLTGNVEIYYMIYRYINVRSKLYIVNDKMTPTHMCCPQNVTS